MSLLSQPEFRYVHEFGNLPAQRHCSYRLFGYEELRGPHQKLQNHRCFQRGALCLQKFKDDVKFIDLQGACIAPGFIDTHIHGIEGHGTDDQSPDSILKMSESLTKYGVTSFIPTLYSAPRDKMIKDIKSITAAMGKEKAPKFSAFIWRDRSSRRNVSAYRRRIRSARSI